MAIVSGNVSLIMTKSLSYDIKEANTWFSCIIRSEESKVQLEFWQEILSSSQGFTFFRKVVA